jgi:transposase InsO family protein
MKDRYPKVNLVRFCRLLGVTRQAYYQHYWDIANTSIEEELVIQEVLNIRKNHRYMGGRKIYELITPFMLEHQIKMGRDALFDLLAKERLLVRKKKRRVYTTQSFHWLRKYPNLIREFVPTAPNQLWVSDITYWKINNNNHVYISFITDTFSHKIVGYHVAESLESIETIQALKMALSDLGSESHFQLIHHSDRGVQYCHHDYVKLLQDYDIKISMTENGDPFENAIAERVNGIIKEEYLCDYKVNSIIEAKQVLDFVVKLYNDERPHNSIGNLVPNQVHELNLKPEKLWRNYYQKNPIIVNQF